LLRVGEGDQIGLKVYPYHDNDDDWKRDSHEPLRQKCDWLSLESNSQPPPIENKEDVDSLVERYDYTREDNYLAELRNTYEKAAVKITSYLRRSPPLYNLFNFNRFLRRDFINMMRAFSCIGSILIKSEHKTEVGEWGEKIGKGSEAAAMAMEVAHWPGIIGALTKGIGMVFEFACKEIDAEQQIKRIKKLLGTIDYGELDEALFVSHLALQLTMMYQMTALALPEEPQGYEFLLKPSLPDKNLAAYLQAYEDTYILVKSPSKLIYVTTAGEHENIPIGDQEKLLANIQSINPNNSSELRLSQQQFDLFITKNGGYNPSASASLIKRSIESMEKFAIDNSVPSPLKQFAHFVSAKLIIGFLKGDLEHERYQAKPLKSNEFIKLNELTDRLTALVLSPSDSIWEKIKQNAAKAVGLRQVKLNREAKHPGAGRLCDLESLCSAAALYDPSEDKYYSRTVSNELTQVQRAGYISCRAEPYVQWFKFQPALFNWKDHKKLIYQLVFKPEENAAAMADSTKSTIEVKLLENYVSMDKYKESEKRIEQLEGKVQESEKKIGELEGKIKELEKNQAAPKDEVNKSQEALKAQPENQAEVPQQNATNNQDSSAMEKLLEGHISKKNNGELLKEIIALKTEIAKMQKQINDLLSAKNSNIEIPQPAPANPNVVPVPQLVGVRGVFAVPPRQVPIPQPEADNHPSDTAPAEDQVPPPNTPQPKLQ
jgi:uncharacterized coiled-coil protein SlyX